MIVTSKPRAKVDNTYRFVSMRSRSPARRRSAAAYRGTFSDVGRTVLAFASLPQSITRR